jgi:hypothetical protein
MGCPQDLRNGATILEGCFLKHNFIVCFLIYSFAMEVNYPGYLLHFLENKKILLQDQRNDDDLISTDFHQGA